MFKTLVQGLGRILSMGNREDLLSGAKRCLYEKGYSRTTARDIAAASGVSLAAIGYHFKSTEALLNAALNEALDEWGAELQRALSAESEPQATPLERFELYWTRVLESFTRHRPLLITTCELVAHLDHIPQLRQVLAEGIQDARALWAKLLQNLDAAKEKQKAFAVGSIYQALLSGVMVQWLIDPEHAPSARDLAEGLRTIAASIQSRGAQ